MAWWDHEELKDHKYRSDRYKLAFPTGYTQQEIDEARTRQEQRDMTTRDTLGVPDPWKMHQDESGGIPTPPPPALQPPLENLLRVGVGVGGAPASAPVAALNPKEKLFVFTEHEYESNGSLDVFETHDIAGVVAHLEEREQEDESELQITVIRGVEVPVKKGTYTIG